MDKSLNIFLILIRKRYLVLKYMVMKPLSFHISD